MQHVDVAIIGAGVAGLTAAQRLVEGGLTVALVEARDRLGGRIFTAHTADSAAPIEYGAEFVHGMPPETFALRGPDFALYEVAGEAWAFSDGQLRPGWEQAQGREHVRAKIAKWQGSDRSLTNYLAEHYGKDAQQPLRQSVRTFVEGFDAADPADVSVQWLALSERAARSIHEERQFRAIGGYDRLVALLHRRLEAAQVPIHLNTIVREVQWSPGAVNIGAHDPTGIELEPISARAALITLPLGVLLAPAQDAAAVRFVPDLSEKATALAGVAMGHVMRVVLRFREVFWENPLAPYPHLPEMSFLMTQDTVFPAWWTTYPLFAPQLTAWVAGPRAAQMLGQTDDAIVGQAVAALAHILSVPISQLEGELIDGSLHNWGTDPFARGAYSYVRVGGLAAPGQLGAPIADTLFFAGEATNTTGHTGTVHGAIATGHRAAEEILRHWT